MNDWYNYPSDYPNIGTTQLVKKVYKPSKRKIIRAGKIEEISFTSDQGKLRGSYSKLFKNNLYMNEGDIFKKPDWKINKKNQPITHEKGRLIKLKVGLTVKPIGEIFNIVGIGTYFMFEATGVKSQGKKQYVPVESKGALPNIIGQLDETIQWYIKGNGWENYIGTSGPHSIYILWGDPNEKNSWKMDNYLTEKRIELITKIASKKDKINSIAKSVQVYLNNNAGTWAKDPKKKKYSINYNYNNGAHFWGMLDGHYTGQCAETAYLMEMMLRLLGIEATQKQVHAVTKLPVEDRVSYQEPKPFSPLPEYRHCKIHGDEWLWLDLVGQNESEGCCEVDGRFYALYVLSDIVGIPSGKRTAAHHVLLQLEQTYGSKVQIWVYQGKKVREVCKLPKNQSGGDPYPPVPKLKKN